jgi:hypothetical protein
VGIEGIKRIKFVFSHQEELSNGFTNDQRMKSKQKTEKIKKENYK